MTVSVLGGEGSSCAWMKWQHVPEAGPLSPNGKKSVPQPVLGPRLSPGAAGPSKINNNIGRNEF